jgi:hypothetical protein
MKISMKKRLLLSLLVIQLAACDSSPSSPEDGPPDGVIPPISDAALLSHLNFFAADSLYGRRAGSEHERRSAEYIRDRFIEMDLEPGAPSYFQEFTITVPVDGRTGLVSQNVLGILRGQGSLAGQWVILGAHYDHVGYDDNASGTSLMLEVAGHLVEYFSDETRGEIDRRSIMFQAYGAEEVGLIGSTYYCGHPGLVMDSVMAMVNLDMVGRLRNESLSLIGASSSPGWAAIVAGANTESLSLTEVEGFLNRSDQYCFYQREKPVLFLHTGLHPEYHTPSDDVELINEAGMVRVGDLTIKIMLDLIYRYDRLVYTGGTLPEGAPVADLRPLLVH